MQVLYDTEWETDCVKEVRKVAEQLVETYPCDSCNVEVCYRRCYKMTLWAEKAKEKLAEYETAEEEERLVVLPVGIGDEVYIIEKCSNIPERLDGTLYDSDGGPGTATGYYCPYEENCPFDGDDFTICDDYKEKLAIFKDYVNEIHIRENEVFIFAENTCQYCSFGKTMFLTREEAEKALRDLKEQ